jgi:hypothetical protein
VPIEDGGVRGGESRCANLEKEEAGECIKEDRLGWYRVELDPELEPWLNMGGEGDRVREKVEGEAPETSDWYLASSSAEVTGHPPSEVVTRSAPRMVRSFQ